MPPHLRCESRVRMCHPESPEKRTACRPGADPWGSYRGPPGGGAARREGLGARGAVVAFLRVRGVAGAADRFGSARGGWRALPAGFAPARGVFQCDWPLARATSARGCQSVLHGPVNPGSLDVEMAWMPAAAGGLNAAGHPGAARDGAGSRSWAAGVVACDPPQGGARPRSGRTAGVAMSRHFLATGVPVQCACCGREPPLRPVSVLPERPDALRRKAAG